ncbi:hypothetical protein, partial [Klebsiella pneumoniae]|uniref:hypothetical protein n=1 Tax=Klebsiella pneumoniae TaxID=573 RepID=UPI001C6FE201
GCVGCLVGHLFMFLVGGKTPDQSVHLNLTTTPLPERTLGGVKQALIPLLIPLFCGWFASAAGRRIDSCPHFLHNLQRIAQN